MSTSTDEPLDLTIVGAGIYGICAATTYLSLHPDANIRILEADSDVGGVWSTNRSYTSFWSQSAARVAGFHDIPFKIPEREETYQDFFDAKLVSRYLENYATERGLRERCAFETSVTRIQKVGEVWEMKATQKGETVVYRAKKLIVATGLFTDPNVPTFTGRDSFKGLILHQKEWGRARVLTPEEPDIDNHTHITILGGAKSAADIVYAAATDKVKARTVNWIIRTSGSGPLMLVPAQPFGKYRNITETGSTRAIAAMSTANPWNSETWFSWFIHKTAVGDWLMDKVWNRAGADSFTVANFEGREGALSGFEGLKPKVNVRWRTGYLGALQRDPEHYWDIVARNVHVHRSEVKELREGLVVLENGEEVQTDVLLCATGFKQEHTYFSTTEAADLGLPVRLDQSTTIDQQQTYWEHLECEADKAVLRRWPYLANPPPFQKSPITRTPYRLYNHTIPLQDRSIAFLGIPIAPNSYHVALVQSLYAIAMLDGRLALPERRQMEESIARITAWNRRKYPAIGDDGNNMEFEMVSFTDKLLEELGLESHKHDGWWMHMTEPVWASDYAGLVDEYRNKYIRG